MTDVTLREFFERILDERTTSHAAVHEADRRAVTEARAVVDARLEKLNELRVEVLEDRSSYITRDLHDAALLVRDQRIDQLESFRSKAIDAGPVLVLFAGVVGALIARALS